MLIRKIEQLIRIAVKSDQAVCTFPLFFGKITIRRTSSPVLSYSADSIQCSPPSLNLTDAGREQKDDHCITEFKSPMIGTFYSLITVPKDVRESDIVAIINALGLDNEIVIDIPGQITEVCVKDGDPVEWGQTLFKLNTE